MNPAIYNFSQTLQENQRDVQQRRTRPQYQDIRILGAGFNSNFNGLEVSLNKRFSRGLTMTANYTWSKSLDYASQGGSVEDRNGDISNPSNILAYYGLSDWDVRNRFIASLIYDLPSTNTFVRSRVLDAMTRNWTLSSIITLRSGFPFGIGTSGDVTPGAGGAAAVQLGPLQLPSNRSNGQKVAEWFNVANVAPAAPGTYGTMGRNTVSGPGYENVTSPSSELLNCLSQSRLSCKFARRHLTFSTASICIFRIRERAVQPSARLRKRSETLESFSLQPRYRFRPDDSGAGRCQRKKG